MVYKEKNVTEGMNIEINGYNLRIEEVGFKKLVAYVTNKVELTDEEFKNLSDECFRQIIALSEITIITKKENKNYQNL